MSYRIAPSTVQSIVVSTCDAIWRVLSRKEMPEPTEDGWKKIADDFWTMWQFPNCIGAVDGKHVQIQAPKNSGSLFYNYKKTFSVVLMALVDANYKFIVVDVGGYGKSSDGGIFSKSNLGKALEKNNLHVPGPRPLPNSDDIVPFVILGDEAFPLKENLLRPYPGSTARDNENQKIFNYRLSRARRVVENAFGILIQKFRILYGRLQVNPENADKIILAACVLHNYLRNDRSENTSALPVYEEQSSTSQQLPLRGLRRLGGNSSEVAIGVRNTFCNYLNTTGAVPWQLEVVRRGIPYQNTE